MVTASDDGIVRTHDDAAAVLRYAVPGASVSIYRVPNGRESTRGYEVSLSRWGRPVVAVRGTYACGAIFADELTTSIVNEVQRRVAA